MPPTPEHGLGRPGATSEFFQKNLWKERKFAAKLSHAQTKARIEYWVSFLPLQSLHALSLRVIAYEPGALTEGGNMRSPLKPPSYNPCHPWDDFMRSRETCMCLCWAESGGCERSEVRSPTTPSRVCTMSRLYCFACVPNAESTNDMAHMQQSYFCPRKGCNIIVTLCEASRLVADDSVVFRFCSVGWTTDEMVLDRAQAVHPGFAILAIVVGWTQVSLPRACYMCVCSDVTDLIFIAWPCCARALSS